MAQGKMRIGYAIMTPRGNLVTDHNSQHCVYKYKEKAVAFMAHFVGRGYIPAASTIVRVTIDTDA